MIDDNDLTFPTAQNLEQHAAMFNIATILLQVLFYIILLSV